MTNAIAKLLLLTLTFISVSGCTEDNLPSIPDQPDAIATDNVKTFEITSTEGSTVDGSIEFTELNNGVIRAITTLNNTTPDNTYPIVIRSGNILSPGKITLTLEPINGTTGSSTSLFNSFDNTQLLSFDELDNINGHLNIYASFDNTSIGESIAQIDLGGNQLSGKSTLYPFESTSVEGVSGEILFIERKNETTIVEINIDALESNGVVTAFLRNGNSDMVGSSVKTLTSLEPNTSSSVTDFFQLNNRTPITYDELINYNGLIELRLNEIDESDTIITRTNIGSNATNNVTATVE